VRFNLSSAAALTCAFVLASPGDARLQQAEAAVLQTVQGGEAAAAAPAAPSCCKLAALTPVELEFVDSASSRTSKSGEQVALKLAEPLVVDGRTVAPIGAKVVAEVIQASKAGMMGKAGELTFAARYLEIGAQRVPLKRFGFGRTQGSDPTGTLQVLNLAAAAALPVASVALIFVSGGNVDIKTGARAHAVVSTETLVPSHP
jgi:hypothetical protein